MTLKMPAETLHFEWTWSSTKMFSQPSTEIENELTHLQEFGIYNPDLTTLGLVMSTSLSNWVSNMKIVFTVIFILVLLLFSIMCLNCYNHYRRLPRNHGRDSGEITPPFGLPTPHTSSEQMNEDDTQHHAPKPASNTRPAEMTIVSQPITPRPTGSMEPQDWTPPLYDAFNRQILTKTKSGNLHCINLPRPPDQTSGDS